MHYEYYFYNGTYSINNQSILTLSINENTYNKQKITSKQYYTGIKSRYLIELMFATLATPSFHTYSVFDLSYDQICCYI